MKRYMLWAMFALATIALVLTINVATVQGPSTMVYSTDNAMPDGLYVGSSGTVSRPVRAASSGMAPCIGCIPSRPVIPGRPAVSLAPDGTTFGPFHAYEPADICAAYGVDRLHKQGLMGQGQTIVVVDSYGSPTALEDLQIFSRAFGLPDPDLTIIYPDGKPTYSEAMSGIQATWAGETSLDLQWAHAIAPCAKLVLVAANPAESEGVQGFPSMFKGISYAVANYPGSVISQSFAVFEQSFHSAAEKQVAKFHRVYEQAAAARCTVLSCSGDDGTANTDKFGRLVCPFPTVCWPASDPLVTACGGTQLQWRWRWDPAITAEEFWATVAALGDWEEAMAVTGIMDSSGGPRCTEAVWNEAYAPFGPLVTGGGLSVLHPTPDFQLGLPQDLLQGRRGVPDMSWNAALNGGVLVYMSGTYYQQPYVDGWTVLGGTSASTPQLAGLIALANQLRAENGKGPIGYLNPVLYTLPAEDFNDIVPETFGPVTLDNNAVFGSGVPGFDTTPGYDLTTGLGSPKAYEFVRDLAEAP
jgi:subtilase family serine protease